MEFNSQSNGKELFKAILHSLTGKYAVYVVQLITMMILARVFTPEVFGIMAILFVFSTFFSLFAEMGLAPALISQPKISLKMRNGVFSVTVILGFIVALIFLLVSPIISILYKNPEYQFLVIPVCLGIIFNTASIVPIAALQKDRQFILIAKSEVISEVLSLITIIISLYWLTPLWALAFKPLIVSIFKFYTLFLSSKYTETGKPAFGRELAQVKMLFNFSLYQAGFNFLNFFSRNLDNLLVGKYFNAASLGVYDKAYQLMRYPMMLLTFAMSPAIQPVMSKLKDNPDEFERLHNKFLQHMSIIGLLVGLTMYFLSDIVVAVVLGKQWEAVVPLLQVLSITLPIQIVLSSSGGFFQAFSRPDLMFKCGVFSSLVNVSGIIFAITKGDLVFLCWALVFCFSINFLQCYWVLARNLLPSGFMGVLRSCSVLIIGVICFAFSVWFGVI